MLMLLGKMREVLVYVKKPSKKRDSVSLTVNVNVPALHLR